MLQDQRDVERAARLNRRVAILFGAQIGVAGLLGLRLHQLQIRDAEQYQTLAEENRINLQTIPGVRGRIFDRFGAPLAVNRPNYRVRLIRERAGDPAETLARLGRLIELGDADDVAELLAEIDATAAFVPVLVRENLSWEAFARVAANAPALPGVETDAGLVRDYPERDALAHVVGYVARVTREDLAADRTGDPALRLPDARIGESGVEKHAEMSLRGSSGVRRVEVDAAGRIIRELTRDEGAPGDDLTLTIDARLQAYAMARVAGLSAAAVVMDVATGDLRALVSAPAFDPNLFTFGISHPEWNALRDNELDPLRSKAVAGAYPPGSTFKMITALAGLGSGEIDLSERVRCTGGMRFGDRTFHCWRARGHGPMDLRDALKQSCDVYFYELARRVGIDRLAETAARFGIGAAPAIASPNVRAGVLPTPDWLQAERGRSWTAGETLNASIGQGLVLTTPLQLATMTARLATGRRVSPRLIQAANGVARRIAPPAPLGFDPEHLAAVRDAMDAAVNEERGTAHRSRIVDPALAMAGKTGTSQVRSISAEERAGGVRPNEDLPRRLRDHALFVAYAPIAAPRYAIAVVVEHGGGGSTAAAPVARDILLRAMTGEEPSLSAYPEPVRSELAAARAAAAAVPADIRVIGD